MVIFAPRYAQHCISLTLLPRAGCRSRFVCLCFGVLWQMRRDSMPFPYHELCCSAVCWSISWVKFCAFLGTAAPDCVGKPLAILCLLRGMHCPEKRSGCSANWMYALFLQTHAKWQCRWALAALEASVLERDRDKLISEAGYLHVCVFVTASTVLPGALLRGTGLWAPCWSRWLNVSNATQCFNVGLAG